MSTSPTTVNVDGSSPTASEGRLLTVASVPSSHVYVRHLSPASGPALVRRLADPDPDSPGRSTVEKWWPPVMLRPEWVREHDVDVFHLQFGFDACSPEDLAGLVASLRETGTPYVHTVHDLRNPHHTSRAAHDAQLDVLLPAADAIVTLTPGAAAEIRRRWGRDAVVLPHPHVVELDTAARIRAQRAREPRGTFRIGLHVKSLRASMDPMRILPALVETARALPRTVLQVNAHRDVLDDDGARRDEELASFLRRHADGGDLELEVHDFLPDDELWAYLASLDVSVLPYRFGTHSGWLEACRDLGTTVVAPSCGYFAEQGPVLGYVHDEETFDADSLVAALTRAHEERPRYGASLEERRVQRAGVAEAHERLYRSLVRR
jgi:glycosyltransferase involved in cell wall biosynthesis